jgi:two-component system sensor histidine kinase/response regulator
MGMNGTTPGDGFDRDTALARVGDDVDLLKEIAGIFLEDCPRSLAELRDAAARGDFVLVERSAHNLKGAASNFGAGSVVGAAWRIEKIGNAGKLDDFGPALVALEAALAGLRTELEALIAS